MWWFLHEVDKDGNLLPRISPRLAKLFQRFHLLKKLFVADVFAVKDDGVRAPQLVPVGRRVAILKRTAGLHEAAVANPPSCFI